MTDSQLLDKALDFIVETQEDYDRICEEMGEWCEQNCISTLNRQCVLKYLKDVYEKE